MEKEESTSPFSLGLGGGDGGVTTVIHRFKPVEIVAGIRGFQSGKLVVLVRGFTMSRTGPVSRPGWSDVAAVLWFPSR
ncbi:hypothetical protein L3X38_009042 [Prunus dulcis]|uniref:Uncharacterized protein n=1 Tax=Prunus dulcis TaxID=3755 RepID=A0AAD5F7G7_PRUDU|nr:hypothetical protein L3X38_009042 [Prunus dulcis]